jgi:hypothetical protein
MLLPHLKIFPLRQDPASCEAFLNNKKDSVEMAESLKIIDGRYCSTLSPVLGFSFLKR